MSTIVNNSNSTQKHAYMDVLLFFMVVAQSVCAKNDASKDVIFVFLLDRCNF